MNLRPDVTFQRHFLSLLPFQASGDTNPIEIDEGVV